jgi:flagellar protein FlaF
METAITALIVIGVMVLAILGLSNYSLSAQAAISGSSRAMQEREGERARTNLTVLGAATSEQGDYVQVTLKNSGLTKLADFEKWDMILEYSDGLDRQIRWYPYGGDVNQWSQQISPEVFDPGILNPGEEMVMTVRVSPPVATSTTNLATITTPNGITASTVFTH